MILCTIFTILVWSTGYGCAFEQDVNLLIDREIRPNHGVVFQPLHKKLLVSSSVYDLILTIQRPKFTELDNCDSTPPPSINWFCKVLTPTELEQFNTLVDTIDKTLATIDTILHSPFYKQNDTRSPRAMLGFVGKLSSNIFGVATHGDVRKIANVLNQAVDAINNQDAANDEQFQLLQLSLNTVSQSIRDTQSGVILNSIMLTNLTKSLNNTAHSLARTTELLLYHISTLEKYVSDVVAKKMVVFDRLQQTIILLGNFLEAITDLMRGSLSYHLVPPKMLKEKLDHIQDTLDVKYPGHMLVHTDLTYYYNGHHLAHYTYTDSHILIHLQVPFALENSLYNLYTVKTFPVPINTSDPLSKGYTTIPNLQAYFATSTDGYKYTELDNVEFSLCHGTQLISCPMVHIIRRRPTYTCTASIFYHDIPSFMNNCAPIVYPNAPIPTTVHSVGTNTFLVTTNRSEYEFSCQGQFLEKQIGRAYAILTVPCACTLYLGDLSVTPSLTDCLPGETFSVSHPINYALFLSFDFDPSQYQTLKLSNSSVVMDIPDINSYVKNFTDISDSMVKDGLRLDMVSDAILDARLTYSKTHTAVSHYSLPQIVSSPNFLLTFVIIVIVLALAAAAGFLILKSQLKKLDVALAAATVTAETAHHLLPGTEATYITKTPKTFTTSAPESDLAFSATTIMGYFMLSIIGIMIAKILIKLIKIGFKYAMNKVINKYFGINPNKIKTEICLIFINEKCSVLLRLMSIPLPNTMIKSCLPPKVICLAHMPSNRPKLQITWASALTVAVGTVHCQFELPTYVYIPRTQAQKFVYIMQHQSITKAIIAMDNPLKFLAALDRITIYDTPRLNLSHPKTPNTSSRSNNIPLRNLSQVIDPLQEPEVETTFPLVSKTKIKTDVRPSITGGN